MKILLIIYAVLISQIFTQSIEHERVTEAIHGNAIELNVFIDTPDREISNILLMYRSESHQTYLEKSMDHLMGNQYKTIIPSYFIENLNIYYFFVAEFVDGGLVSYPYDSPYENPMIIEIDNAQLETKDKQTINKNPGEISGLKTDALIISPPPNSTVPSDELVVILSFFSMKNVDVNSINVFFDEVDISDYVIMETSHFTCPFPNSKKGRHRVRIEMNNNLGQSFESIFWEFNVINPKKTNWFSQLVEHRGKIWSSFSNLNIDGLSNSVNDLNIKYYANLDWIRIDVSGLQSSLNNPYMQTRNRYSIHFINDNIKISLGDFFPQINKFSMNGNRIRGFGADFKYRYMNLNVIKGKIAHEIQGNILDNAMVISLFDSLRSTINISRDNYTFKREVTAIKFGIGIPKQIYLNIDMVKAKDNISSVYEYLPGSYLRISEEMWDHVIDTTDFFNVDNDNYILYEDFKTNFSSLMGNDYNLVILEKDWEGKKPKDNFIIGSDFLFSFDEKRVTINTGFTFSLLNQNIWESITSISELDTLAGDTTLDGKFMGLYDIPGDLLSYNNIFELGVNQVPLFPIDVSSDVSTLSKMFNLPSVIYNFETKMNYAGHNIKYKFLQVGSEFNSLVNPYIQRDIREKVISDRFRVLGNRMAFNLKWSRKENGIDKHDKNTIFTNRYDTNMGLYPGADLPTFNIGLSSIHRKSEKVRVDEIIIDNVISGEDTTIITDNRLETLTKQINLAMTNTFEVFGHQQLSMNLFKSEKEDIIFDKKKMTNPHYFSPQMNSSNLNINIYSKHSDLWESNVTYSSSTYNTGLGTELHPDYFQKQDIERWSFKIIRNDGYLSRNLNFNFIYSNGSGTINFTEHAFSFSGIHELFQIFQLTWRYGLTRKSINSTDTNLNTSFRAKLLYSI